MQRSSRFQLIRHGAGAPGLRLGLGPGLRPVRGLHQLRELLNSHSFWAQGRSLDALAAMLRSSAACVSVWSDTTLVGFGRASSDGVFRAVLWDVVVDSHRQGHGLGRRIVDALLEHPKLRAVERVYLMTSNSAGFYERLGFEGIGEQRLMLLRR